MDVNAEIASIRQHLDALSAWAAAVAALPPPAPSAQKMIADLIQNLAPYFAQPAEAPAADVVTP